MCNQTAGWYNFNRTCISRQDMVKLKVGKDLANLEVRACTIFQCLDCIQDFKTCSQCEETNGLSLYKETGSCEDAYDHRQDERIKLEYLAQTKQLKLTFL